LYQCGQRYNLDKIILSSVWYVSYVIVDTNINCVQITKFSSRKEGDSDGSGNRCGTVVVLVEVLGAATEKEEQLSNS